MKPVNLIPQDQRRRQPTDGGGKGAPIALGVLAALLAMVVGYVLTSNTVTDRKDKAQAASEEATRLEAQVGQQSSYTGFAQIAQQRLQSVSDVAAKRFDWERFMRELAHIMPEGSWLQTADASVTGDPAAASSGITASTGTTGGTSQPAANLIGCTPDQDDVAGMMVRLGQLYRVEDVQLNDSTIGSKDQEAGVTSCGAMYTFNITVKFTAAEPAREAPHGTDRVPASLGGGS